ncbi:hypothetical protein [Williamsoniiplasma luminosum]|uniref:Uncharacterized protein n=1 Tax=Williamsoniiplasma luminosum TaxID=214888 RepID=A0A2S0NJ07_9MOLU|nr:hypothetical protein [Williamsoniiplasma luminosum]AVP48991.1 MAG: hypothetical protein C5T88_00080 [Williamsoniiplasma luminosum]
MRRKLQILSIILIAIIPTTHVVGCSPIGNDPFEYMPYRISGFYNKLWEDKTEPISIKLQDDQETQIIDYSPLLTLTLKSFGNDKFALPNYSHLYEQFIDELTFYKHFAKDKNFVNYENLELIDNTKFSYKDKKDIKHELEQIIRIDNFSLEPIDKSGSIYFSEIMYSKWNFVATTEDKGHYVKTNKVKSSEIFLYEMTVEKIKQKAKLINELN